jgi:hypothetical protein
MYILFKFHDSKTMDPEAEVIDDGYANVSAEELAIVAAVYGDGMFVPRTYEEAVTRCNSLWREFMPCAEADIDNIPASYSGIGGRSIADEDGRYITQDGVRFNVRMYHFDSDPGEDDNEQPEEIPDFVGFDVESWRFVLAASVVNAEG